MSRWLALSPCLQLQPWQETASLGFAFQGYFWPGPPQADGSGLASPGRPRGRQAPGGPAGRGKGRCAPRARPGCPAAPGSHRRAVGGRASPPLAPRGAAVREPGPAAGKRLSAPRRRPGSLPEGLPLPSGATAGRAAAGRRHGEDPHPGADGADGALRGPAADGRRGAAAAHGALREPAQLPAQLRAEPPLLRRPPRPAGLHHGGGQRRQVLQQDGHRDRRADGRGQRGKRTPSPFPPPSRRPLGAAGAGPRQPPPAPRPGVRLLSAGSAPCPLRLRR